MNAMQLAQGKWPSILHSHGIDEQALNGKHSPCPLCGGRDRFRWISNDNNGRWICNQCKPDSADGMDLLREYTGLPFKELAMKIEKESGKFTPAKPTVKKDPLPRQKFIAKGCVPISYGDAVSNYLFTRNLPTPAISVRFNPAVDYFDNGKSIGKFPAMVSRVTNKKGERESFHITYLNTDGSKAKVPSQKKMLPPVTTLKGCGVYLSEPAEKMVIGEGIETTLAGQKLFGLPGVAALTAGGMESIELPAVVKSVVILSDKDASFTGQKAAYTLANRLVREGYVVEVKIPPDGDFADVLMGVTG